MTANENPTPAQYMCTTCGAITDTPGPCTAFGLGCGGTAIADHAAARITAARRASHAAEATALVDGTDEALDAAAEIKRARETADAEQDSAVLGPEPADLPPTLNPPHHP